MRSSASFASRASPLVRRTRTAGEKKPQARLPHPNNNSQLGKLQFKDSNFASDSLPQLHNSTLEQRFESKPIDHNYLLGILSRKDWCLLLNDEVKAQRLILNARVAVSILQNQDNALCSLRFYAWLSNSNPSLAKIQSVWSALCNALYREGPILLSSELVHDIRNSGCGVTENLLCALIGSWGRLGLAKYCSEVFEQVSYLGISPSTRLYNAVIDGLVKSNALDLAYLKFQQMEVDNCVRDRFTYNILIHGVCKAGVMDEAVRLVKQMEGLGHSPNVFTYTILIDGYCNAKRVDEAFKVLERMKARNVRTNDATYRSLVNGAFRSLPPNEAFELLSRWVKKEPNIPKVVYDTIAYCLCNNSLPKHTAAFFRTAGRQGYIPDSSIANVAVACLLKGLDLEEVCQVYEYFVGHGVKVNLTVCLALIKALYISGREDKGNLYISWLLSEGLVMTDFSYNMVIDCFCQAKMMDRAIETLRLMSKRGILPNIVTFNTLISGCCKDVDVVKAREILVMIFDRGLKPDVFTFNSIINVLCQAKQIADAFDCFQEMMEWGISPNVVTYNSLIHALCICGDAFMATKLLGKMQINGIQPDVYTFNAIIQMYCKVNKIDKARRFLKRMLALDLCPDCFTYSAFMNAFCESGSLPEVKALFTSMETNGYSPDAYLCNAYVDCLVKSGEFQEARDVWLKYNEMGMKLKPLPVQDTASLG
ncbi:putative pentatricopeptide repeat-containing protein At3g16890, mitochondrial [Andrographis paniculata]|uniref:putative pentatricopeptide repeat-containing protein At3g16890, mitochondrial n=1 Tax=Andrographis paniculata TaxID=175694 RepID=UPI0021E80DF4|nr:putative pentatricopeptide repeat-containing protein At3g16890, mitochondrial [Andrographis paniculata]XP_051130005.1 putative pentatricopeptide repeat-containing protein At3g16890, mitochondrial [Andrographis paniculata]XP_051130011.1 putative pentatricopeptide repeat-containing protein At3g16890, mitochondrial [Andrographis paniculata]XP_051130021.1 putative pentatricopeptide repeat-containing protein At3g16890, mitochondrial [Andrographis paniculata]XP_051130030.1 putative pentatricopepti